MEISKDTFEKADKDTKLNFMFDIMKATHDCIKGANGDGLEKRVTKIETSQKWSARFQLFILAAIGKLMSG